MAILRTLVHWFDALVDTAAGTNRMDISSEASMFHARRAYARVKVKKQG